MSEIVKHEGQWCMQGWPVSYLKSEATKLGIHRTASNNSMNGRRFTPEDVRQAVAFVPPREPGVPRMLNEYHGNLDCTCGQRMSVLHGTGTCRFCGQEWTATVTLTATHPFTVTVETA